MKNVPIEQVKVNVSTSNIKGRRMAGAWQAIASRPEIAINGHRKFGILGASQDVRL